MNFSNIVIKHFDFLVTGFGYSRKIDSETIIQYHLKKQSVIVAYDSERSYEVAIFLYDKVDVSESISFHCLCLAYGTPEQIKNLSSFFSTKLSAIENYLEKVSIFMQAKMQNILAGDRSELKRVQEISQAKSQAYTQTRIESVLRENANTAWAKRDYVRFLEIMSRADFTLTELDKRKIEFAQKGIDL